MKGLSRQKLFSQFALWAVFAEDHFVLLRTVDAEPINFPLDVSEIFSHHTAYSRPHYNVIELLSKSLSIRVVPDLPDSVETRSAETPWRCTHACPY